MRYLMIIAGFIFLCAFTKDDNTCLEVKGTVLGNKKKLDKLEIVVYENGVEVQRLNNAKSPFKLSFPRDHYYSMEIKKAGYLPAIMIVDTNVPKNKTACGYHFTFEYDMIAEQNDYNQEYVDYPAAVLQYIKSTDEFLISAKYNKFIKNKIGIAQN